ncbi:hypothetical protein P8C59_004831 [Phyllachora maydis]|nr:hypothetical protein P8C59_004831 [Phyllachora maydis]
MNKWQTMADMQIDQDSIRKLEPYCSEFLVHAADNEGLQRGIDADLVRRLAEWCSIPVTYAGGGRDVRDLELVRQLSHGKVDLTIGSALDCFGGGGVKGKYIFLRAEQEHGVCYVRGPSPPTAHSSNK